MENLNKKNREAHHPSPESDRGFTLVELMIAMAIGLVVLGAMYGVFTMHNKTFGTQEQIAEMQQSARAAMGMMTREIRMAGCGDPDLSWIDWVTIGSNPEIVQGSGSDPDTISIIGCFDSPRASLSASTSSGATLLTLSQSTTETSDEFDTTNEKVISIGGIENAIVTSVSTNILTIDTNPATTGNQGLSRAYGVGTPIYLVKVIGYSIVEESNTPILKRNENIGAGRQPLAENIEDLQIYQSGNSINVSLTARTANPDPDYTPNGGYRTYTLTSVIIPRNLGL